MPPLAQTIGTILAGTTGTLIPKHFGMGAEAAAPAREFPLARITEQMDGRVCPLCMSVHGMVIRRDSPQYAVWSRPSHINCRRYMIFIGASQAGPDGKPTQADFEAPDQELIDRHGHFVSEPKKYEALRVPNRPTGRDFVAYRKAGAEHVTLRVRDALPNWALQETLREMAGGIANPALLNIAGDRELAFQILSHAADRGLFRAPGQMYATHADDWPAAGTLSETEFAKLPERMTWDEGSTVVPYTTESGRVEWLLHNESLPLRQDVALDDVAATYSIDDAAYNLIGRLPDDVGGAAWPAGPSGPPSAFPNVPSAEAWARSAYPHMTWSFRDVDPHLLADAIGQWHELAARIPQVAQRIRSVESAYGSMVGQGGYAWANNLQGEIFLAKEHWDDRSELVAKLAERVRRGWLAEGSGSPRGIITHEFGHHVWWHLNDRGLASPQLRSFVESNGLLDLSGLAWTEPRQAFAEGLANLIHLPEERWSTAERALRAFLIEWGVL